MIKLIEGVGYSCREEGRYGNKYNCVKCKVGGIDEYDNYCRHCGVKIKWVDENNNKLNIDKMGCKV